ncbi:hypothetical protein L484_010534 [Morus notabilis]|uniref:Uncharacterized protein n=1 Tax=Morus notabilis TaxID=981085 RepID=W9R308_9ROSA|nr:hypothetical protein L484_010534 [Morus notabilis]
MADCDRWIWIWNNIRSEADDVSSGWLLSFLTRGGPCFDITRVMIVAPRKSRPDSAAVVRGVVVAKMPSTLRDRTWRKAPRIDARSSIATASRNTTKLSPSAVLSTRGKKHQSNGYCKSQWIVRQMRGNCRSASIWGRRGLATLGGDDWGRAETDGAVGRREGGFNEVHELETRSAWVDAVGSRSGLDWRRSGAEEVRQPREAVIGDRLKLTAKWGEGRLGSARSASWRPDRLGLAPWGANRG